MPFPPDRWTLGFNDPSVMGWVLTIGYGMVALGCGRIARRMDYGRKMERLIWGLLGILLLLLAVNKQFDLQNLLRDQARGWFLHQSWYAHRRYVIGFGLLAAMAGLVIGSCLVWRTLPESSRPLRRTLTGVAALGVAVALRFLPVPVLTRVLGFTFFETQSPVWQFHAAEVIELALLGGILGEVSFQYFSFQFSEVRCQRLDKR